MKKAPKAPYDFTAKSRAAMTAYLIDRKSYHADGCTFPFSWNVKAYRVECDHPIGEAINPALDAAWRAEMQATPERYYWAVEDAQRNYRDEWTSYPGADQGDWKFGFYGRSGGHLCLEEWRKVKTHGRDFDLAEWLASIPYSELRAFYRGIVCADSDFTGANACDEIEARLNDQRAQWEADLGRTMIDDARQQEAERPDMYHNAP